MKQQDLLASVKIGQDFSGNASHCNTFFFLSRSVKFNAGRRRNIMPKGKTRVTKVKGGKRAAEKQDVTSSESTDSLRKTLTAEMKFLG